MFRNLATSLFRYGSLYTTAAKAKALRPVVERLITAARTDTLANRRNIGGYLTEKEVVHKLFVEIAPSFRSRPGGYTRIVKSGMRRIGDNSDMAYIELIKDGETASPAEKTAAPKTASKKGSEKKAAAPKKVAKAERSRPKGKAKREVEDGEEGAKKSTSRSKSKKSAAE